MLGSHTRVLWSSFPLHWKPNILLVNYDSWWQHQMSLRELRHDRPSGRFSKSLGLSASVSFLSSPPPPSSFTGAIFRAVLDSRSSFFAPNTCRTETLATQARKLKVSSLLNQWWWHPDMDKESRESKVEKMFFWRGKKGERIKIRILKRNIALQVLSILHSSN